MWKYLTGEIDWIRGAIIAGILILSFFLNRFIRWLMTRSMEKASDDLRVDATRYKFLKNAVTSIIVIVTTAIVIYMIPSWRSLAITLFAGAGILVAILGFAAQEAFSNIIGGVFIVMFRPFRVGDVIKIRDDLFGHVDDINLRHTVIVNFENKRIIVPNAEMSRATIINNSIGDPRICEIVEFGISYDSDIGLAMKIIREEAIKHPHILDYRTAEQKATGKEVVEIATHRFEDSSLMIRAWCWAPDFHKARWLHWDLNKSIKERFDKEGVEIPFPYRTIVYKRDLEPNATVNKSDD